MSSLPQADTMPTRTQRKRTKDWRAGSAMIVDRSSRYGNPWRVENSVVIAPDGTARELGTPAAAREHASTCYRAWLHGEGPDTYAVGRRRFDRRRVLTGLSRLQGRDLACTCPLPIAGEPDHCHATVLLELAAPPERTTT
ncbi:DUF4326 domain-containing protein [Streptomyces sp. NPDC048324]|uniref:DUF4326 domain-containing protein n=1 Tax=Streptomyces sp. NPDC048324 TaxID=3157205 RepID=UPI00341C8D63